MSDIVDHIGHVVMVDLRHDEDVSTSESQSRMVFMNNVDANAGTVVIGARLDDVDVASSLPCIVPVSVRSAPIVHQQMIIQEEEE